MALNERFDIGGAKLDIATVRVVMCGVVDAYGLALNDDGTAQERRRVIQNDDVRVGAETPAYVGEQLEAHGEPIVCMGMDGTVEEHTEIDIAIG